MHRVYPLFIIFLILAVPLWSQNNTISTVDPLSFIGLRVDELVSRFGPPREVYASRGQEPWQDDVVFIYSDGEFYIYKERVWQAALKSARGISVGDTKPAVILSLGEGVVDQGEYILFSLPSVGWPMMLRVNFNSAGRVSAIFVYRSDY